MKKILLLLIICIAGLSVIKAQTIPQLQQSIYIYDTLNVYNFTFNGSNCAPYTHCIADLNLIPVVTGVSLKLLVSQLNAPPGAITSDFGPVNLNDEFTFSLSYQCFNFYSTMSGTSIKIKLIIEGIPTVVNENYPCQIIDSTFVSIFDTCLIYFGGLHGSSNQCLVANPNGVNELDYDFRFNIYPNPSSGNFNMIYLLPQNKEGKLEVLDITGKVVYEMRLPQWSTLQQINLPNYISNGLYNCVITSGNYRASKKIAVVKYP